MQPSTVLVFCTLQLGTGKTQQRGLRSNRVFVFMYCVFVFYTLQLGAGKTQQRGLRSNRGNETSLRVKSTMLPMCQLSHV